MTRKTVLTHVVCLAVGVWSMLLFMSSAAAGAGCPGIPGTPCGNGDVNGDGMIDLGDAVYLLSYLFGSGAAPVPISGVGCEEDLAECQSALGESRDALAQCSSDLDARDMHVVALENQVARLEADRQAAERELAICGAHLEACVLRGLPATGETRCHDGDGAIDCEHPDWPGQDGRYQAGCALEDRFVDNGNGTVTDWCTMLMWQKESAPGAYNWQDALKYCDSLDLAGHTDWRLPNVRELQSIMDYGRVDPAIDPVFGVVASRYWSSTTDAVQPGDAWNIFFYRGTVSSNSKTHNYYVRAVRQGQTAMMEAPSGMVRIPTGEFQMGDAFEEAAVNERPVHAVWVDAFFMDRYLVTKALWDTVRVWALPRGYPDLVAGGGKGADHPVYGVNWYDCVKWCNARSEREGRTPCYYVDAGLTEVYRTGEFAPYVRWNARGYRLPTEAEWEKAGRGGAEGRRFPWSSQDTIRHTRANYFSFGDEPYDTNPVRGFHPAFTWGFAPHSNPVGYFAPNGFGLHDMAGNLWEWCYDWYDEGYYSTTPYPHVNPRGPTNGIWRIARGGYYWSGARQCRVAFRGYGQVVRRDVHSGFRCVLAP